VGSSALRIFITDLCWV